jgi:hypothetical protein
MGGWDHTTILHGVRAVESRLKAGDAETVGAVKAIQKQLQVTGDANLDVAVYQRLAEANGAMFTQSDDGTWSVKDQHGLTIAEGALSIAEAARLFCEDKDLAPSQEPTLTPDPVLARIIAAYRPYDAIAEFGEGFIAYQCDHLFRRNPYRAEGGVKEQAWDRGNNAAMLYSRALAHMATTPTEADDAEPDWMARLLRTGRCQ